MNKEKFDPLEIAERLESVAWQDTAHSSYLYENAASELRRLHEENMRLRELVYFQSVDDTAEIPAILKRQAS